jgi:hypothetical protein
VAAPLDLAGGANAGAVGIQQHPQQHPRRIGGAARIRNSLLYNSVLRKGRAAVSQRSMPMVRPWRPTGRTACAAVTTNAVLTSLEARGQFPVG